MLFRFLSILKLNNFPAFGIWREDDFMAMNSRQAMRMMMDYDEKCIDGFHSLFHLPFIIIKHTFIYSFGWLCRLYTALLPHGVAHTAAFLYLQHTARASCDNAYA